MKLLICQSCGVVIRTRGKHCTGCGVQLALNTPTQMPAFSQARPPLAVSLKQDHLLLERVVTERQLNALAIRPRHEMPGLDDGGEQSSYGANPGGNGNGNGDSEHHASGNGGNGNGTNGKNGNSTSSLFGIPAAPIAKLPNEFFGDQLEIEDPSSADVKAREWSVDDGTPQNSDVGSGQGPGQGSASAASPAEPGGLSRNDFDWQSPLKQAAPDPDYAASGAAFFQSNGAIRESGLDAVFAEPPGKAEDGFGELTLKSTPDAGMEALKLTAAEMSDEKGKSEPQDNKAPDAFFEDKSAHSAASSASTAGATGNGIAGAPDDSSQKNKNPILQVASLSSQPGAAISIAIGGGMAGFMAGSLLRPPAAESKQAEPERKPESAAAPAPESSPSAEELAPAATQAEAIETTSTPGSVPSQTDQVKPEKPAPIGVEPTDTSADRDPAASKEKVNPIAIGADTDGTEAHAPLTPMLTGLRPPVDSATENAKSELENFFGKGNRTVEKGEAESTTKRESSSFFGDDEQFDFFSAPADPAARRPTSTFVEDEPAPRSSSAELSQEIKRQSKEKQSESDSDLGFRPPGPSDSKPEPSIAEPPPVEAEAQARPKVAMPKSITQNRPKLKVSEDEAEPKAAVSEHKGEEHESEDEEEEKKPSKSPQRRSFSGASKPASPALTNKTQKSASDAEDEEDEDSKEKDASKDSGTALNWLEEEISFMGLNVSRKTAGVLIAVGLFILVQIPGWLMSFVKVGTGAQQVAQQMPGASTRGGGGGPFGGGMPGGQAMMPGGAPGMMQGAPGMMQGGAPGMMPGAQGMPGGPGVMPVPNQGMQGQGQAQGQQGVWQPPIVAGQWKTQTELNGQVINGIMVLQQSGTVFAGQGQEGQSNFQVQGQLQPPDQIVFAKKYDEEARRRGAFLNVIIYSSRLLPPDRNTGLVATDYGQWQTQVKKGYTQSYFNKSRMETIRGKWTAQQVAVNIPQQTTQVASNPGGGFSMNFGANPFKALDNPTVAPGATTNKSSYQEAQHFFLMIAGFLIAVGVTIFLCFLRLFGPGGQMNIWEKEKYIPSQFRSLHMKMVYEFGKPLKPGSVPLGKRMDWKWWSFWNPKYLSIPVDIRRQNPHILIMGGADKGKTSLMASMVTHDIKSEDRAIVLIDSDGQLSDLVIEWIASQTDGARYAKRVVLVDPTYKAGSLAYNPLEMPEDGDLQAAASAIVHGFKAIYTEPPGAQSQWNAQTANILRNAALLLIANGRTLTDLPMLLQDNDFRDVMLEAVERKKQDKTEYITISETWNQYKKLARTDQWINWVEPILNRVGPMLSDGRIRPILTKPVSDLKLKDIIKQKKILIVKIPQGELDQNANLLGSLMITGLQQATMSLCRDGSTKERPVALYVDEMDNFIEKETVENITSETMRFQIGFCATVKTLQHLPEDYRNQLVISMGTMCIFALSKKDGDMLGPQMFRVDGRKIKHQTIQNFFNKVNTSPQFELIMDEEKLNIDRIVGQNEQTYFCYRVGTVAGVFKLRAYDFKDIPEKKINKKLVEKMHAITDSFASEKKSKSSSQS